MLSAKLVNLIEDNWQVIAQRLIDRVKRHPDCVVLSKVAHAEHMEWCQQILQNLGELLSGDKREEVRRRWQLAGRYRYQESVPLHEAVLRIHILKDQIINFVHEQGFPMTSLQLYAEEELEHRVCSFFDAVVYSLVRGYEQAMRRESAGYA